MNYNYHENGASLRRVTTDNIMRKYLVPNTKSCRMDRYKYIGQVLSTTEQIRTAISCTVISKSTATFNNQRLEASTRKMSTKLRWADNHDNYTQIKETDVSETESASIIRDLILICDTKNYLAPKLYTAWVYCNFWHDVR